MKNIISLLICTYCLNVFCQTNSWSVYEIIVLESTGSIAVQFKESKSSCNNNGRLNKYRFEVKGDLKKEKYSFDLKYTDCNKKIKTQVVELEPVSGLNESMDYSFS